MKKLLLTLGTVAAVAAPVASVVACGTTNEVANPEFQAVSVKGLTFTKVPYLTTDFKGFEQVTGTTSAGDETYLVPTSDIVEKVTTAAVAEVLNANGSVKTPAAAAVVAYTIKKDSATAKAGITAVTNIVKGTHTVLAEKAEVSKINAGKPGVIKILTDKTTTDTFLTAHIDAADRAKLVAKTTIVKVDGKTQTDFDAIVEDFYASTFKAADDAATLKTQVTKAVKVIKAPAADTEIKKLIKDAPTDATKLNAAIKAKRAELVKQVQGAASLEAINLILLNDGLISTTSLIA